MGQNWAIDPNAIRARIRKRMEDLGIPSLRALSELTGDEDKNVQRWVGGHTGRMPADYLARLDAAGFASARWLATGQGPKIPGRETVEALAYRAIARTVELIERGDVGDVLEALGRIEGPEEGTGEP